MSEHSLANRHIVVTGGLGVLGRAVGAVLVEQGARVVLLDRVAAQDVPGITAVIGGIDLTDPDATRSAFQQASERLQGFDGLVNAAGGFRWETLESGALESWDALYAMNLRSTVVACREALPRLLAADGSGIVNVGALAAQKAGMGMGAYAASKAGLNAMTEGLAHAFGPTVRVNTLMPGPFLKKRPGITPHHHTGGQPDSQIMHPDQTNRQHQQHAPEAQPDQPHRRRHGRGYGR